MKPLISEIQTELKKKFPDAKIFEHNERRYYITIPKEKIGNMTKFLYQEKGLRLAIATGIDTREGFEIIYHFSLDSAGTLFNIKVLIPKDNPTIQSLAPIFESANWIEREIHELLGINFEGHPNMKPLLTADDWPEDKHPLRRDYEQ
jgi:NADH:ubiquinone oxidoreductase subunit C